MWRVGLGLELSTATPAAYRPEAAALFERMSPQPDGARKAAINTLIGGLVDDGIWSNLDAFYMLAAHNSQAALLDWIKADRSAVAVNSPTFEADRGYTGNGSSSRVRTNFTPSVDAVKFLQDDASLWVWSRTEALNNNGDVGSTSVAPLSRVLARSAGSRIVANINDASATTSTNDPGTAIGLFGASRLGASTRKLWCNGVEFAAGGVVNSAGVATQEQWICGANGTNFSARQCSCAIWGSALGGKEAALYSRILTYMQAIGAAT